MNRASARREVRLEKSIKSFGSACIWKLLECRENILVSLQHHELATFVSPAHIQQLSRSQILS